MKLIAMVLVSVVVPWLLVVWARRVSKRGATCEHKRLRHWGGRRFAHLHGRHTVGVDCLDCGGRNIDARIL